MRTAVLLAFLALVLGGCQTIAAAIGGMSRDIRAGIDAAHQLTQAPEPRD